MPERVLLLLPTTSYKATDFLAAAERLGVDVVVGSERRQALQAEAPDHALTLDFLDLERSLTRIRELHERRPLAAVVGSDDETAVLAARAASRLGLPHNPAEAVAATRDKHLLRWRLAGAGRPGPAFRRVPRGADLAIVSREVAYPCVLKPLMLSASRGVLRADDPAGFVRAFRRIAEILDARDVRALGGDRDAVLVEDFVPGAEVALEGLLRNGRLRTLALFDKPDPLDGPTFAETLYVTPSRLSPVIRQAIEEETARCCAALGLVEGPVHAELRLPGRQPWLLEVAARTIGGLCARALRFGTGVSLEELVLRHALGREHDLPREARAAGVMMLPVLRAGVLSGVRGTRRAREVPGIEEVTITLHRGARLVPLPEGHRYLGFLFARGDDPAAVEHALREASSRLQIDVR